MTPYSHTITAAVPVALMEPANHLACLMGESAADIGTFRQATYQDATGIEYAVCHSAVTLTFIGPLQSAQLPERAVFESDTSDPPYDRALAQQAFESLNQPGGMLLTVDVDPHRQFAEWGLEPIPSEDSL